MDSFFVLELAVASSGDLAHARWDMLDMTIQCLQVYWEESKIACFINFFACRDGVISLAAQLCLGWSSCTLLQY